MKKVLVLLAVMLDGIILGLLVGLLLSREQRLKLSKQLAPAIEGMMQNVPDE